MEKYKEGWSGPLVDATAGMDAGVIAYGLGYMTMAHVNEIMASPEKQRDLKAGRYRHLYEIAPAENKKLIREFIGALLD